jgi:hypothetical protein
MFDQVAVTVLTLPQHFFRTFSLADIAADRHIVAVIQFDPTQADLYRKCGSVLAPVPSLQHRESGFPQLFVSLRNLCFTQSPFNDIRHFHR